jgi:hypothetical protein
VECRAYVKLGSTEVDDSRGFERRLSSATDVSVCSVNILAVIKFKAFYVALNLKI